MPRPSPFISGERFGHLVGIVKLQNSYAMYLCDCGMTKAIYISHVQRGRVISCGCFHEKEIRTRTRPTKHGMAGTSTYHVWVNMLQRCRNPLNRAFANYGGRGIDVCPEWETFEQFHADMGNRPAGMTLDRKNNSLGYCAANCQWISMKAQQNNKRSNVILELHGESHTAAEWAEKLGINQDLIYDRKKAGWSDERTLTEPKRGVRK